MEPSQDSRGVAYLFYFAVRLNAGKPEEVLSKYHLLSLLSQCCMQIRGISPQEGYLVVMLHIECGLTTLVFIFLVAIHVGGGEWEIIL